MIQTIKDKRPRFTKARLQGVVRHLLTAAGGVLIAYGYGDEAAISELVGTIMTLAGLVWSFFEKPAPE